MRNVYPGSDIQAVLNEIPNETGKKHVKVHTGVYIALASMAKR